MTNSLLQPQSTPLVHWTYNRNEWRSYLRWSRKRKGIFHYIYHRITSVGRAQVPNVTITQQSVTHKNSQEVFADGYRQLKQVNIRDEGMMNVLEINYEINTGKHARQNSISVLIPRGKLREAVALQITLDGRL